MKIKTYKSDSVSRALAQIKKELGPGAIILNTKRSVNKRLFGLVPTLSYEITAAADGSGKTVVQQPAKPERPTVRTEERQAGSKLTLKPAESILSPARDAAVSSDSSATPHGDASVKVWSRQVKQLSSEVAELKRALEKPTRPISSIFQNQVLSEPFQKLLWQENRDEFDSERVALISAEFQKLVNSGLDESVAFFLNRGAARDLPEGDSAVGHLRSRLNAAITEMIKVSPICQTPGSQGSVSVFLGPTGVGKTTTIAKLAAKFALNERKKVRLLTLDTFRIAAAEQLKIYGEIIGVPVRVIHSIDELDDVICHRRPDDCLLIDTTGHSHKRVEEYSELANYLSRKSTIQKYLVLSTTTSSRDLTEMIDSFGVFSPDGLIFTKLDESSACGVIINELVRTKKPLSCLTNGQNVPDDLVIPNPETVANLVVPVN